jgi:hypothetical protein
MVIALNIKQIDSRNILFTILIVELFFKNRDLGDPGKIHPDPSGAVM